MKLTIFIVAIISAAFIAVAIMLSFNPDSDFKSDLDDIPLYTEPDIKWDLSIETATADYWEQVKGLKKKKETSQPDTTDEYVTDENGKVVTDENGDPVINKNYENVTDENGEIVTDENGQPVTDSETNDEKVTDENGEPVTDKKGNIVTDTSDKKASVTDVPENKKTYSKSKNNAH